MKVITTFLLNFFCSFVFGQQVPDTSFNVNVAKPTYTSNKTFLYDEAHRNFHRSNGTYQAFTKLLVNDGLKMEVNRKSFDSVDLAKYDLLVIANPMPVKDTSAYTSWEIEAVYNYVQNGGALLVITDHFPVSKLNEALLSRFGVQSTIGTVEDSVTSDKTVKGDPRLVFSKQNGLLPENKFTKNVTKVISFTGQGLKGPDVATSLLDFSKHAYYQPMQLIQQRKGNDLDIKVKFGKPVSAQGWSQALAFPSGKGRVIVTGEAAMLTAQKDPLKNQRFGMNYGNNDNKQLLMNMIHWLIPTN